MIGRQLFGYFIILVLGFIFYFISFLSKKHFFKAGLNDVDEFILAGRKIPFAYLSASIFVSWVWTTTIMGATEAGMWYGVSGGLAYAVGAGLPFFIFIPVILRFREIMPGAITIPEFIGERYNQAAKNIYFIFCILVVIYVIIEQAVGIGITFYSIFGIPFKVSTFIVVMLVTAYVTKGGMRGVIYNDIMQFFAIVTIFIVLTITIIQVFDIQFLYKGLLEVKNNPNNYNYNPDVLSLNSPSGIRYGLVAVIVAMGQIFLDQGYYSKAFSAVNSKTVIFSFLAGGIFVWIPISIISAVIFGYNALALNVAVPANVNISTDICTYILTHHFQFNISVFFAVMIFMIGITTSANCLVGIQTLFVADYYKNEINKKCLPKEQIQFGRVVTVFIGFLCALIAISLEGISLLKIDIFSGIFFAAPCAALIMGFYLKKITANLAIISIFIGITFGLGIWITLNNELNWFYGILFSFVAPIIFILIGAPFSENDYNFTKLKFYHTDKDKNHSA